METRFGLPTLTARDAAAQGLDDALTLQAARTDDPLEGVVVPTSATPNPAEGQPTHLQEVQAELVSRLPLTPEQRLATPRLGALKTSADYDDYIRTRTHAWKGAPAS